MPLTSHVPSPIAGMVNPLFNFIFGALAIVPERKNLGECQSLSKTEKQLMCVYSWGFVQDTVSLKHICLHGLSNYTVKIALFVILFYLGYRFSFIRVISRLKALNFYWLVACSSCRWLDNGSISKLCNNRLSVDKYRLGDYRQTKKLFI